MSKDKKLIAKIMESNSTITVEDAIKVLSHLGYSSRQPKSGSSHITFFKPNFQKNITLVLGQKQLKPYQIQNIQDILKKEGY